MVGEGSYGIDARKARWREFLDMDGPPGHVFLIRYEPDEEQRPWPWSDNVPDRIEWSWRSYERHMARTEWLREDSIPCLDVYTGTDIFAEAFGCDVHRPADDMPFARPLVRTAAEASRLSVPDVNVRPLAVLFEIGDELRRRAGPDAIVKLVDIQSPMDIAALIWDKNSFYAALLDAPDAVREIASKVGQLLTAFLDEWFARYGTEFIAHYPHYYMPRGITLSEDEVGAVSAECFDELFLPELVDLSNRYGGIGVHCCATARHQWEGFERIPSLRLLNLVQPKDVCGDAHAYFAGHTTQMHGWTGDGPAWEWPAQYPPGARVVTQAAASDRDEAIELSDRLWDACGRE